MSEDAPLSDNLSEYRKAMEQELSVLSSKSDEATAVARDKIAELLPTATQTLQAILIAGDTDNVRLAAVKLVFEHTLGNPTRASAENELARIMDGLKPKDAKNDSKEQTTDGSQK